MKKAYFEAARACHPDLHGATPANIQRFQDLSLAVDSILRELAGDNKGRGHACAEDGVGAATGGSASAEVSHDDPDFASSFYEFINREMSDATRNEIKAAVSLPPQTTADHHQPRFMGKLVAPTLMCLLALCAMAGRDGWRRAR